MRNWLQNRTKATRATVGGPHEPLDTELPPMPSERATGLVFAGVAIIVAAIFRTSDAVPALALATAAGFALTALAVPRWLGPLNRAWFALALMLNRIVSPAIMFLLFAVLIVPAGLAMQMRRDPLRKIRNRNTTSYWIDRSTTAQPGSMGDQF